MPAAPSDPNAVSASLSFPVFSTVLTNASACFAPWDFRTPFSMAISRSFMIASIGLTPFGQTSSQNRHVSQSQTPFGRE